MDLYAATGWITGKAPLKRPGTILRVSASGRCLWFQVDCVVSKDGDGTAARFVPDPSAWIYRVIRQPDGVYREDHDMRKVLVGVRRFRERRNVLEGEPGKRTLAQLEDAMERLEPWLLKTRLRVPGHVDQ